MKALIREKGKALGFTRIGVTSAAPVDAEEHLRTAIADGRIAQMHWLARNPARRCDPTALLPGARSVICCALPYGEHGCHSEQGEESPCSCNAGDSSLTLRMTSQVARYARGADYHDVVRAKLEALRAAILERAPGTRAKLCVDTSPILEKALAQRAGIGWIGKHTVLVNETLGSWFVLGEILTDLELEPDAPAIDRCGTCRACLDACPTGALPEPRVLDARRCISYLTIEARPHRLIEHQACDGGQAPRSSAPSDHVSRVTCHEAYGCDRCQEACPYNRPAASR